MKKSLISLFILIIYSTSPIHAEVYKTKNPDGSITFSDVPKESASEKIKIPETSTIKIEKTKATSFSPNNRNKDQKKFKLTITSPKDGQNYYNAQANQIPVSVQIEPRSNKIRTQIFHNGQLIKGSNILNPHRGSHSVVVKAVHVTSGKVLATSPTSTFYVHRAIAR